MEPRKTVASGSNVVREAQLYEQYSEHRRTTVQRAAGFSTFRKKKDRQLGGLLESCIGLRSVTA